MLKEQVKTPLGSMAVATSWVPEARGTLFFWAGLFFDGSMWDSVGEAFMADYNIVVIDPPGHGASDGPSELFSMADCAQVVKCVLDTYKLPSCIFVGLSWGGFVAQAFAKRYPSMCDALVLMNTCSRPPNFMERCLFFVLSAVLPVTGAKPFESALLDGLLSDSAVENDYVLAGKVRNQVRSLDFKQLKTVFHSVMRKRESLDACLSDGAPKAMVIFGTEDASIDRIRTDAMVALLPAGSPVTGLAVGHNAVLEASDAVVAAMTEFLDSLSG